MSKFKTRDQLTALYFSTRDQLVYGGCEKFVTMAEEMYKEFKEKDGYVTCEQSTKALHLDLKITFLSLMSQIDDKPIGCWEVGWCSTCYGYNAKHPFHCEMVRYKN